MKVKFHNSGLVNGQRVWQVWLYRDGSKQQLGTLWQSLFGLWTADFAGPARQQRDSFTKLAEAKAFARACWGVA